MKHKIVVEINKETALKLKRRAERLGMSVSEAVEKIVASKNPFFWRKW